MSKVHVKIAGSILFMIFISCILYYPHGTMAQGFSQNSETIFVGNMRIDNRTGIPITIFRPKTRKYSGSPNQIAHQYLQENKDLLGMIDDLSDLELVKVKESLAGKHVSYRQVYKGVPVMGSGIVISINKNNCVYIVVNHHRPDIPISTIPTINEGTALQLAKNALGSESYSLVLPQKIELKIYQDSTYVYHLVWRVILYPDDLGGEWLVLIDAQSGEILMNRDIAFYYDNYVDGRGLIFNPDPASYFENHLLPDSNDCNYFVGSLSTVYKEVVLQNLIDNGSNEYRLQGKYAWSFNTPLWEEPVPVVENDSTFIYYRDQTGFEEVNAYYHINTMREYIGSLGFHPYWHSFLDTDTLAIPFDARAPESKFNPHQNVILFGVRNPNKGFKDFAEDQSVIIHEYGHALHDAFLDGGLTGNLPYPKSQIYGISEGIADYLSLSYRYTLSMYRSDWMSNWTAPFLRSLDLTLNYDDWFSSGYENDPYKRGTLWATTLMSIERNLVSGITPDTLGRDDTHKLLFTSLASLDEDHGVEDYVKTIYETDREIFNGEHIEFLDDVFTHYGFPGPIEPEIALSDSCHDFGNVDIFSSSEWVFRIYNNGGEDLEIDSVRSNHVDFEITSPAFPQTLVPLDSLDVTVTFAPSSGYAICGTLEVFSNDPDGVTIVELEGHGLAPDVSLKENSHYYCCCFDSLLNPPGWTFDIKNVGNFNLTVDTIFSACSFFVVETPIFPQSIAPDCSINVMVSFTPLVQGLTSDSLFIVSDDPDPGDDTLTVSLSGTAAGTDPGDVNCDEVINVLDVLRVVNSILGVDTLNSNQQNAADCKEDEVINILDVICIVNIILGISPGNPPIEKGIVTLASVNENEHNLWFSNPDSTAGVEVYIPFYSTFNSLKKDFRSEDLDSAFNVKSDTLIAVLFGPNGEAIVPGNGPIFNFSFSPGANPHIANVVLSTPDGAEIDVEINHQPEIPGNPYPADEATDQSVDVDLSWSGGDPDTGNTVTYDVYLGTSSPPPLFDSNLTTSSYDPGTLVGGCTYYWQIVARDNHEVPTYGPEWTFSTPPNTVDLYPIKDTYIIAHPAYQTYNTGVKTYVSTGRNSKYPGYVHRTLMEFDLSGIPSGAVVDEASIHVFIFANTRCKHTTELNIFRMEHSWEEGTGDFEPSDSGATWLTSDGWTDWLGGPGAAGAGDCEQTAIGAVTIPYLAGIGQEITIPLDGTAIEEMLGGGSFGNYGFLIKDTDEYQDAYVYHSSESSDTPSWPRLEIIYRGCGVPPCDLPQISDVSPASGDESTTVLINGSHFSDTQGTSYVTFYNNVTASVNTWSNTQIECTVPVGAESGNITVTTDCGTSNGKYFTVTTGCDAPSISSLSPSSGDVGSSVWIYGNYFGPTQEQSYVTFSPNETASIDTWANTQIKCTVPAGAISGDVTVTTDCGTSNGEYFTVTTPGCDPPSISSLNPNSGDVGSSVWIYGNYFGASEGQSYVTFHPDPNNHASISIWSDTEIKCSVPVGAEDGDVIVTTYCEVSNGVYFDVTTGGDPGCPYVSPWIGDGYAVGNNILAASEDTHRTELNVVDYFRLEQPCVEKDERYWLQISEFEQEHTWLDEITLKTVDHPQGLNLGVTDEGGLFLYKREIQPVSCVDSGEVDQLGLINTIDDGDYEGFPDDWLTVDFGHIGNPQNMYVEIVADLYPPKDQTIVLQLRGDHEWDWHDIALLHPRQHWATHLVDLSPHIDSEPQDIAVRLYWLAQHKVDYICLAQSVPGPMVENECVLESAVHSVAGVVTDSLSTADENYAELVPGENIEVSFIPTELTEGFKRDFVMVATGHYITEEGGAPAKAAVAIPSRLPTEFSLAQNYPNPFNPETEIAFALPEAARVTLTVYNILGQVVEVLIDSEMRAGYHSVVWNGENVASGIYFYRMRTGEFTDTKRMLLLK